MIANDAGTVSLHIRENLDGGNIRLTVSFHRSTSSGIGVRPDRIDDSGVVTLRYNSKMHHIGIGRAHKGEHIRLLIHDRDIRIINPRTGELLRELTLNPAIDYQPQKPQNALPKESEL